MIRIGGILIDALLDHVTEMANEALDRPGGRIAQCADRMALDLIGDIQQHIDLALFGAALGPLVWGPLFAGKDLTLHTLVIPWFAAAGIALRTESNLWPLWDTVVASTLEFSGIRLRNAQARPEGATT